MIALLLKGFLPRHLDWIGDVVGDVVDIVEDGLEANREGWTEAHEARLVDAIAETSRKLAHGIRTTIQATEAAPRRRRRVRG